MSVTLYLHDQHCMKEGNSHHSPCDPIGAHRLPALGHGTHQISPDHEHAQTSRSTPFLRQLWSVCLDQKLTSAGRLNAGRRPNIRLGAGRGGAGGREACSQACKDLLPRCPARFHPGGTPSEALAMRMAYLCPCVHCETLPEVAVQSVGGAGMERIRRHIRLLPWH